jgi:3-deoxy-manno-octulosonate cytidylyltransferase (CMP-KDO synthetase)
MKKIVCIIPARLKSTRFPRKALADLSGKPLIQWVWEAARRVELFDEVAFAIDSHETARVIEHFGGNYFMTSEACPSGTDRLIELMQRKLIDADIWVNWQGDEPFINQKMIQDLLQSCDEPCDIWTLKKKIIQPDEIASPNVSKVVCDAQGFALYFSRHAIPYYRDTPKNEYYKHIGLYAFSREALQKIAQLKPCALEEAEQLEQLRFLYHRLRIRVHETDREVMGIDLPEHLDKALAFLSKEESRINHG